MSESRTCGSCGDGSQTNEYRPSGRPVNAALGRAEALRDRDRRRGASPRVGRR